MSGIVSPPSATLTDLERAVLGAVHGQARRGEIRRDLAALIRIPSVTGTAAESDAQAWTAARLEHLGLDVDSWPLDLEELAARPDFPGTEAPRSQAWGVVGTTPDAEP